MIVFLQAVVAMTIFTSTLAATIPPIERVVALATTTTQEVSETVITSSVPTMTTPTLASITFSSLVTIAPLSRNPLELRQRCFNDQGFSVNCATWTGYYYTWGGAGHPYAGGPGEGGGTGNGNGNGNSNGITGIISEANRIQILLASSIVAFAVMCLIVLV